MGIILKDSSFGVVDKKYLEKVLLAEKEGREIRVSKCEIEKTIIDTQKVIDSLYKFLIK